MDQYKLENLQYLVEEQRQHLGMGQPEKGKNKLLDSIVGIVSKRVSVLDTLLKSNSGIS